MSTETEIRRVGRTTELPDFFMDKSAFCEGLPEEAADDMWNDFGKALDDLIQPYGYGVGATIDATGFSIAYDFDQIEMLSIEPNGYETPYTIDVPREGESPLPRWIMDGMYPNQSDEYDPERFGLWVMTFRENWLEAYDDKK